MQVMFTLGMQQYGSLPYYVLLLSVLQYVAVLRCHIAMITFEKEHITSLKLVFSR